MELRADSTNIAAIRALLERVGFAVTTKVTASSYTALATDSILFVDTDDGAKAIYLPPGVNGKMYRAINCGSSGNDVTLVPNGGELLMGTNTSQILSDGENLDIAYEPTEGWW